MHPHTVFPHHRTQPEQVAKLSAQCATVTEGVSRQVSAFEALEGKLSVLEQGTTTSTQNVDVEVRVAFDQMLRDLQLEVCITNGNFRAFLAMSNLGLWETESLARR